MSGGGLESSRSSLEAPLSVFMQALSVERFDGLNEVEKGFVTSFRLLRGTEQDPASLHALC